MAVNATRALRHPAIHIALLGVLVAAALLIVRGPTTGDAARRVVITGADVLQLRAGFMRTWQREPTSEELRGEIEKHIRQEVLYREALARGYDRDDQVVRRAMQQKMEFLAASQALQQPPTDAEVEAFFSLRRERYRLPAVVSFAQVYINPDAHSDADIAAGELLDRLRREAPDTATFEAWGDPIMLRAVYSSQTERDVEAAFGAPFAAAVIGLEPGTWSGPIVSGYGLHLVQVLELEPARVPALSEVVSRVVNDMQYEARQASREQLYQEIAQTYQVVLDGTVRQILETAGQ